MNPVSRDASATTGTTWKTCGSGIAQKGFKPFKALRPKPLNNQKPSYKVKRNRVLTTLIYAAAEQKSSTTHQMDTPTAHSAVPHEPGSETVGDRGRAKGSTSNTDSSTRFEVVGWHFRLQSGCSPFRRQPGQGDFGTRWVSHPTDLELTQCPSSAALPSNVNVDMNDSRKVLGFRTFSPESRAAVLAKATGLGLSVSDYLRGVVARDLEASGGRGDGVRAVGLLREVQIVRGRKRDP